MTDLPHERLDSVQIGVADLDAATRAYEMLLGVEARPTAAGGRRFQLARGAVELENGEPGVRSIAFVADAGSVLRTVTPDAFGGIHVRVDADLPAALPDEVTTPAIDHIVVRTASPDRAIAVWRDRVGVRLALDREFANRGLRLLFFRSGGITLEYACGLGQHGEGPDWLYGVSYRVPDLRQWHTRLIAAGIDVSEIRTGMRPNTSVCTVRSGTADVPTLLLEVHAH